jgi:AmmeMemoRadiSam system protein B/AmmeMemoRadiSam system protein A
MTRLSALRLASLAQGRPGHLRGAALGFRLSALSRVPAAAAAILLTIGCRGEVGAAGQGGLGVREPAVAGQFYPADARALKATLDAIFKSASPAGPERPVALVVPHAGYVYSGQIAADGWRQAAAHEYDTIVILGTNHTGAGLGRIGVFPGSGLRTPLGVAKVDQALSAALVKEDPDCVADAAMHAGEHSLEVQLPFAQRLFPRASVVAAIVASDDAGAVTRFGRTLGRLLAGRRALIVASSDLSHYPSYRDAVAADRRTLEAIASLDPDRVRSVASTSARGVPNLATCACGEAAVMAAMVAAKSLGATRGRVVSYANSGDLPIGDAERVVGYGAVVFSGGVPGSDTAAVVPHAPAAQALPPTVSDKKQMLALARETIGRYLDTGTVPLARGFSPALDRPQGVFVTLRKRGQLRGCIGQMQPDRPLRVLVGSMALAAAFEDPRFEKLEPGELKDTEIEISILTPFKEVAGPQAIVVGRDGVLLQKDRRSAVFLPQVATEERWTRDEMLDNLCLKGGMAAGCWRAGARLSTFQADVFKEGELK